MTVEDAYNRILWDIQNNDGQGINRILMDAWDFAHHQGRMLRIREGKRDRLRNANLLIGGIASLGRHCLSRDKHISCFELDLQGLIWFVDAERQNRVCIRGAYQWIDHIPGGQMSALVAALHHYIVTGVPLPAARFGLSCNRDPWGYGRDMAKVRQLAYQLGLCDFGKEYDLQLD